MRGVACCAALLVACGMSREDGTSHYISQRDGHADCAGAFTPGSEVCRQEGQTDMGPITTDPTEADPDRDPGERCGQISRPLGGTPGILTVSFATTPLRGTYEPRNCGAVWVEDSHGQFVRTLEIWTKERAQSLTFWYERACHEEKLTAPDVVSSATLSAHAKHMRSWDSKDFRGNVMPDGEYTLWLQVTESEFVPEGPYQKIPFTKGAESWENTPMPRLGFSDIELSYTPGGPSDAVGTR